MILALGLMISCNSIAPDSGAQLAPGQRATLQVSFAVDPEQLRGAPERPGDSDSDSDAVGIGIGSAKGLRNSSASPCRSITNPGTDTEEGTSPDYAPDDVWVIQFDGTTESAPLVGLPRYVELSGPTNIQAVASDSDNTLIFIANTHNPNIDWGNITTLALMKLACRTITRESDLHGNNYSTKEDLVLSGKYVGVINNGSIRAQLLRNIVRLDFTLRNATGSAMTLQTIQLCNVPNNFYYAAGIIDKEALFPTESQYFNYPVEPITGAANPSGSQSFTFYLPQNQRGTNTASTTSKTKPSHAPGYSSYLRIIAVNAQGQAYAYSIYPGANMINDYNLSANHRYSVELSINSSGDASTDSRVEHYGEVTLPWANSHILNPAPVGTSDRIFTIPIERLNEFWQTEDASLMIEQGDPWIVDLIWQDSPTPDLIRFIDPITKATSTTFTGTGPTECIAVTTKAGHEGNALIGIKKVGQESAGYVWSWHLWVTPYNPDRKSVPIDGQYIYWVTGGEVHRYDGDIWTSSTAGNYRLKYIMDRNLGARSPEYSITGALYYQFGRKDPFPCTANQGNSLYDINGNLLLTTDPKNAMTMFKPAGAGVTLATGVLNPTYFYGKTADQNYGDWTTQSKVAPYHWNATVPGSAHKSIFDPCPYGWKIPTNSVWKDFIYSAFTPSLSTVLDMNRDPKLGWAYGETNGIRYWPKNQQITGSIYYPALGLKDKVTGYTSSILGSSYTWGVNPNSVQSGTSLFGTSTTITSNGGNYRSNGFPVRCIQE